MHCKLGMTVVEALQGCRRARVTHGRAPTRAVGVYLVMLSSLLPSEVRAADGFLGVQSPPARSKDLSQTFPVTPVGQTSTFCTNVCFCTNPSACNCDSSGTVQLNHDLSSPFAAFGYRLESSSIADDCNGGTLVGLPVFVDVGQKLVYTVSFSPTFSGTFSNYLNLSGYILSVSGSTPQGSSSLVPYTPSGWSAPVVVSDTKGTQTDSPTLTNAEPLYVSWAFKNAGDLSTFGTFYIDLDLDGSLLQHWHWDDPLAPGIGLYVQDYPFGPLAPGTHTLVLVPDSTHETLGSRENYTKTITISDSAPPPPSLSLVFPLKSDTPDHDDQLDPYSAAIITVFDHSMASASHKYRFWPYGCNQDVVAFTGEEGNKKPSPSGSACSDHPGFSQSDGQPFNITGQYVGDRADGPTYLNYDGHPGFDYAAALETQVFAAVSGTVHYPNTANALGLGDPFRKFHVLEIVPDDDPSYRVYYLHLSTHPSKSGTKGTFSDPSPAAGCPAQVALPLPAGTHVNAGCLVALSGAAGAPGGPHLHFEVHKVLDVPAGSVSAASKKRCLADPTLNDSSH